MVINDEGNELANRSVANALKELKENRTGVSLGEVYVVQINRSDPRGTLDLICGVWDAALQRGRDMIPNLVLDTTMTGPGSETVNSFTAALGLPTVSAQFGQEGDLKQWRNLKPDQASYLIQIMPPADLVPEAIRQLIVEMDVTNAAILFDNEFVMDHKYKSLLQNVPVRHVIVKAKNPGTEIRDQLSRLRSLDIVNFFVLGGQETLRSALDAAQSLNFTGRKYAWHSLTLSDINGPECDCVNISTIFVKPAESPNQQALGELIQKGLLPVPVLSSAFYYDLTRLSVTAMRAAVDAGKWPNDPTHLTCDAYNGTNTPVRDVNLLGYLKNVSSSDQFQPVYANFTWGESNGQHHASFVMTVTLITITNSVPVSTEELGTWDAGVESRLKVGIYTFTVLRYIGLMLGIPSMYSRGLIAVGTYHRYTMYISDSIIQKRSPRESS